MSIQHNFEGRAFRPTGTGGGSQPGKPQGRWPWVLKIIGDALAIRAKGSSEAWQRDRRFRLTEAEFGKRMDHVAPGWRWWAANYIGKRATPYERLLMNRIYKMYYSGTSDRGPNHDPTTRAAQSDEHWSKHFAADHPLGRLHDDIVKGHSQVLNWEDFLDY